MERFVHLGPKGAAFLRTLLLFARAAFELTWVQPEGEVVIEICSKKEKDRRCVPTLLLCCC